jgi:uncharacterized protein (TIRG00374 family)
MTNIKPMYVVISGLCYIFAYVIRSFRWKLLLEKQVAISYKEAWLVSAAGNWINYLIPIRAGELIKAILIKRIKKISAVSIMPSIFFDKFFDTLGIFFVILLIPFVNVKTSYGLKLLIILLLFMFAILFSTMIFAAKNKDSTIKILQRIFFWLPKNISIKIDNLIEIFVNCLNIFDHQKRIISLSLMLTGLGIIFDSLYFYFVFCAFSYNISFLIILFGYTLINLSYVLPQPPAQLGSNEWMMIIIFSLGFGLTKNMASAIMVFAHLFTALIITVLGIIGFTYAGIHSIKQIQKELK